jgi:hypothetical protein
MVDLFTFDQVKQCTPLHLPLRRNARPQYTPQFPTPESLHNHILQQLLQLENEGKIERVGPGEWSSALFPKVEAKKVRIVFDYSPTNDQLESRQGPLPYLPGLLRKVARGKIFSTFDLTSGYHQVPLDRNSRPLTAFSYGGVRYQWKVLPFGLNLGPPEFHHRLQQLLRPLIDEGVCVVYIDDILIMTETREEHAEVLTRLYALLEQEGLFLNPNKLKLGMETVEFLGHTISHNCIGGKEDKIKELQGLPPPRTRRQVRQYLGAINWMSKFMRNVHRTLAPIQQLLRKGKFGWTDEAQTAYEQINLQLQNLPTLTTPDVSKPFRLYCDASLVGCGAVLVQDHGVIGYFSKAWHDSATRWSARERELNAMLCSLRHFKLTLLGRQVMVYSDHESLSKSLSANTKTQHRKMAAWVEELQHYGVKVVYTKGRNQGMADWLSRPVAAYVKDCPPALGGGKETVFAVETTCEC